MKQLVRHIEELSVLHGVSSREDAVIAYMAAALKPLADGVSTDVLGNVTARIASGRAEAPRLLVFAHTDELGLIVRYVEPDGFLRVQRLGGVHQTVLAGLMVDVLGDTGVVPGVLGIRSHHVQVPEQKRIVPPVEELYIDIGAESRAEAEAMGVHTGAMITYAASPARRLGAHRLAGKAMDNRCCCAALIEYAKAVRELQKAGALAWDVYIVACVQEEFNVRGILPAVRKIRPDASIGLDICIAADTPELRGASEINLGGGPAVTYMNFHGRGTLAGVLPDEKLQKALEAAGVGVGVSFQREVISGLITENAFISFSGEGVPVANLSVPCRYSHTPVETIDVRDIVSLIALLREFTKGLAFGRRFGKGNGKEE